ncbi:MAG: YbjN domain-containing protein [Chloroflexaceae bacterium]|nr:YbjN domain-containing protein [Chloroflexaceae bacterium]
MEFLTDAQRECYEKITPWMHELFGEQVKTEAESPIFHVMVGAAFVFVQVSAWGETDSTITARTYVASGTELTSELMLFLLRENDTMRFGAFGIDEDKDIVFQHGIVGSTCDQNELEATIKSVIDTVDRYDEHIVNTWGGTKAMSAA